MSSSKIPPVNYKNLDANRISFTKLEKNELNKTQKVAFIRYQHDKLGENGLVFQTPKIKLTQHGIPSLGKYYKEDKDRGFIKLPFDPSQTEGMVLKEKLEEIDTFVSGKQTALLGKNAPKYIYQTLVRAPQEQVLIEDDDDEEAKPKKEPKEKFLYMKAKFDIDFNTKKLNTLVYKTLSKEEAAQKGKKRELMGSITDIAQLADFATFHSTVRLLVMVNKLWVATAADKSGKLGYGLGLKILQIEVEPTEGKGGVKSSFGEDAFDDTDDVDQTYVAPAAPGGPVVQKAAPVPAPVQQKASGEDNDDDSESDDDSDDESDAPAQAAPTPAPTPVTATKGKGKAKPKASVAAA